MEPYPLSSSLRSRYDYYYSISSPQPSTAYNFFDNQQTSSLFGDPGPPIPPPYSGFSDTFSNSLFESFSRHIDPKLAISYQKADLWQNGNRNVYRPRAVTAIRRPESPSSMATTENTSCNGAFGRSITAMSRKRAKP